MSDPPIYKRHDPSVLMANPTGKLRGPGGRVLCKWCGTETKPPRRGWCSDECVHEYKIRSSGVYARRQVLKRDRGVCSLCGLDCVKLHEALWKRGHMPYVCQRTYRWLLGIPVGVSALWDCDHVVPVVEGGGSCGLDNLRTLCWRCHKGETKKLVARRARRRRTHPKAGRSNIKSRARGL
jgi:hypothetical protein